MNVTKAAGLFRSVLTIISPKLNTKVCYRVKFGRKLDFNNPQTLNEKILWLKFNTYWENPLVKQCADKYRVREYIKKIGCEEILNDLIGAYEDVDDILWSTLPNQFVLKLNVGCGCNKVVLDKSKLDIEATKKILNGWMHKKHYLGYSEMQYKDVKPYILVEKFLGGPNGEAPVDYKFYCLNGKAKYVMVCTGRENGKHPKFWYYDRHWKLYPFTQDALDTPDFVLQKPEGIDMAFAYAEKLSAPFPFVRTDLYIVNGKVYFGELTFTPSGGMDNGRLEKTDELLGRELVLPGMEALR